MTDRKYPAHSTTPSKPWTKPAPEPKKRNTPHALYVLAAVCIGIALAGGAIAMIAAGMRDLQEPRANSIHSVPVLHTNTAEPSETPKNTHTPYPTLSHTPTKEAPVVINNSAVEYIDKIVTVEVTRIVERVITQTPQPSTPTLTATKDLAPEYAALELSQAKRANGWRWLGFGVVLVLAFALGVLFVALLIKNGYEQIKGRMPTIDSTEETAEEISERVPVNDIRREQRIVRLFQRGLSRREIEEIVFGYAGGSAYDEVKRVLEFYGLTSPPPPEDVPELGASQA